MISPFFFLVSPSFIQVPPALLMISPFFSLVSPSFIQVTPVLLMISPFFFLVSPSFIQVPPTHLMISPFFSLVSPSFIQVPPALLMISPFFSLVSPSPIQVPPALLMISPFFSLVSPSPIQVPPALLMISPFLFPSLSLFHQSSSHLSSWFLPLPSWSLLLFFCLFLLFSRFLFFCCLGNHSLLGGSFQIEEVFDAKSASIWKYYCHVVKPVFVLVALSAHFVFALRFRMILRSPELPVTFMHYEMDRINECRSHYEEMIRDATAFHFARPDHAS